MEISRKQWLTIYIGLLGLVFLIAIQATNAQKHLIVSALDVGQGDAILIQTAQHHDVLIDAGPDSRIVDALGQKMAFFDKTIDVFILTHPHADHYGGILDVMKKYTIKNIIITGATSKDPAYLEFLKNVGRQNFASLHFATNNQDLQVGPNLYLDIIFPFNNQSLVGQEVGNKNNSSIVARLIQQTKAGQKNIIILTGDAEHEEEREILLAGQEIQADILKLGHHGSKTATSDVFLRAVKPQQVVISVDENNKFNHPHQETMNKLKGMEVKRTDIDGSIQFNFYSSSK